MIDRNVLSRAINGREIASICCNKDTNTKSEVLSQLSNSKLRYIGND